MPEPDARGRQRGLLLLVAHRAKGLEFDDVVILDDDWDSHSKNEDRDASRRVFYVAMTRARRSLAIMARGRHPFVDGALGAVVERRLEQRANAAAVPAYCYVVPDMSKVDLSYAGRLASNNRALGAIAAARIGDPIKLVARDNKWELQIDAGETIGRMKKEFKPPAGSSFIQGQVGAIIRWRKSDNDEVYRSSIRRDEWETILPSLVFAKNNTPAG